MPAMMRRVIMIHRLPVLWWGWSIATVNNRQSKWAPTVKELEFIDEVANAKIKQSGDKNERFHDTVTQTNDQDEDRLWQEYPETE